MIRFIAETMSSKPDIYGNRDHFATITSAKTGKYLRIKSLGGPSNAVGFIRRLTNADRSEIHSVNSDNIPIREFNRVVKFRSTKTKYEHELTAQDFADLEA